MTKIIDKIRIKGNKEIPPGIHQATIQKIRIKTDKKTKKPIIIRTSKVMY